jgi:hypothetical protein
MERYCARCIHFNEYECALKDGLHDFCVDNSHTLWFPAIDSPEKLTILADTLKRSFHISDREAPMSDSKKELLVELETAMTSNGHCERSHMCRNCPHCKKSTDFM